MPRYYTSRSITISLAVSFFAVQRCSLWKKCSGRESTLFDYCVQTAIVDTLSGQWLKRLE